MAPRPRKRTLVAVLAGAAALAAIPAGAQTTAWVDQIGTPATDSVSGLAVDGAGNAYATGTTCGTLEGQASSGGCDVFVRKYGPSGAVAWTEQFGTAAGDGARGAAADASGNVYVTGSVAGALPGETALGDSDAFVRKYDGAGNDVWTTQFGSTGLDAAFGVAVDSTGNIFVAGATQGVFPGEVAAGGQDAFLTKLDPAGNVLWSRQFGTAATDWAFVGVDGDGNAYVAGGTRGAFAGETSAGDWDAYARKYDGAGNVVWTRQFGSPGADWADGVAVDPAGNSHAAGRTSGALAGQTSAGGVDAFVRKYDAVGAEVWTRQFGTAGGEAANAVALDAAGGVYAAGGTSGTFPGETSAGGAADALVRKYDSGGLELWTHQLGTAGTDSAFVVAVTAGGSPYVAGITDGSFPGYAAAGGFDAFVAQTELPPTVELSPLAATNTVGTTHTVTATVRDADGDPVAGVTMRFSVTGSVAASGSCTTGATGQCDFTYAGPEFPGADMISAFADLDQDGVADPDEPAAEATKSWLLPSSTAGQASGGGNIDAPGGAKVAFGFSAKNGNNGLQGTCNVVDPAAGAMVKCEDVTAFTIDGNEATIYGNATQDGVPTTYVLKARDVADPGKGADTFSIQTAAGYSRSGTLTGGNVQVG